VEDIEIIHTKMLDEIECVLLFLRDPVDQLLASGYALASAIRQSCHECDLIIRKHSSSASQVFPVSQSEVQAFIVLKTSFESFDKCKQALTSAIQLHYKASQSGYIAPNATTAMEGMNKPILGMSSIYTSRPISHMTMFITNRFWPLFTNHCFNESGISGRDFS
jgi:hypothetical protein